MSLKEKIQVVLNQKGHFVCPNGNRPTKPTAPPVTTQTPSTMSPSPVTELRRVWIRHLRRIHAGAAGPPD
jgi:hypothetical protein